MMPAKFYQQSSAQYLPWQLFNSASTRSHSSSKFQIILTTNAWKKLELMVSIWVVSACVLCILGPSLVIILKPPLLFTCWHPLFHLLNDLLPLGGFLLGLGYLLFQIAQKVGWVYFWAITVVKFAFRHCSTDEIREKYRTILAKFCGRYGRSRSHESIKAMSLSSIILASSSMCANMQTPSNLIRLFITSSFILLALNASSLANSISTCINQVSDTYWQS